MLSHPLSVNGSPTHTLSSACSWKAVGRHQHKLHGNRAQMCCMAQALDSLVSGSAICTRQCFLWVGVTCGVRGADLRVLEPLRHDYVRC